MPNNYLNIFSGKLFLICPTDFIEQSIKSKFKSECFFHTALGLNFHWEYNTVNEFLDLMEQCSIDDIVFVSDFRNRFYVDCLREEYNFNSCASVLKISDTLRSVKPKFYLNKGNDEKLKALATKHLWEQENKLKQMVALNIRYKISALLFDRKTSTFLKPDYFSLGFDIQLS